MDLSANASRPARVLAMALSAAAAVAGACGSPGASAHHDAAVADVAPADTAAATAAMCARYGAGLDGAGGAPPAFADVQRVFDDHCVVCHVSGDDLDLADGDSYAQLVSHAAPAAESCGGTLVVPGDPNASYLYQKLTNNHPCAGFRMPRDDFGYVPLPACIPARVGAWIAAGAPGP